LFATFLSLPKYYDPLITALETLEANKLTLEFVKGKLLDQEAKRMNENDSYVITNFSLGFYTLVKRDQDQENLMEII